MRKRLWQLHSWLGLIAGVGLIVIGLTGSLLVFHDEFESLLNRRAVRVAPLATGRLSFDTLFAAAQRQLPDHVVTGWNVRPPAEATYADVIYAVRRGTTQWEIATLNPYTGEILAAPRKDNTTFTGWLLELHYTFFADHTGILIAGLFAVMLLGLGLSGIWIYREFWKNIFRLRWNRGRRILLSDLHRFTGITSVAFNLLLGFTGAYWNLSAVAREWRNPAMDPVVMTQPLYAESIAPAVLDRDAAQRIAGFQTTFISFPSLPGMNVTLYGTVPTRNPLRSLVGSTVAYDASTGAFKNATDVRSLGTWAQIVDMFTPAHYGTFGGLTVKILWSLGGLTPGLLALTGFLIWRQRRSKKSAPDETDPHRDAITHPKLVSPLS